jgi:hypothetical protein
MSAGGIFDGPTALGISLLDYGASDTVPCSGTEFTKALQKELKKRGYGVRQDGIWDGCCQSASIKEVGSPIWHTSQVEQFLGRKCSTGWVGSTEGGALIAAPTQGTFPACRDGSDVRGSSPATTNVPECPPGRVYDVSVGRCMPPMDPFDCESKCAEHGRATEAWAKCLFNCNASGGRSTSTTPPQPTPPTPSDVLGKSLPYILGAMGVGLVAMVYFSTREPARPSPPAIPNRRRKPKAKKAKTTKRPRRQRRQVRVLR